MQKRQISQKISSNHLLILKRRKVLKHFSNTIWTSLDKFFGRWFFQNEKYTSLWKVMIFAFSLSHWQAQIERGFNTDADLLDRKLTSPSIFAQRRVTFQLPKVHLMALKTKKSLCELPKRIL